MHKVRKWEKWEEISVIFMELEICLSSVAPDADFVLAPSSINSRQKEEKSIFTFHFVMKDS